MLKTTRSYATMLAFVLLRTLYRARAGGRPTIRYFVGALASCRRSIRQACVGSESLAATLKI
jgi:hypothetical protein